MVNGDDLGAVEQVQWAVGAAKVALVDRRAGRLHGAMQPEMRSAWADADAFADLVEAVAKRRDSDAFARLFAHYGPRVKTYFRRLGTADDMAEELMQDVMLTLWRRAEMFDRDRASVATWLFTIARNRRIDVLRREYRPQVDANDPALVGSPAPHADERLQAGEVERRVRQALAGLPAEQAELVREAFFRDRSHSVIAEQLRLPLGTVKSRLRLALAKLRSALKDHE